MSGTNASPVIEQRRAYTVLAMNTLAFTVCFAAWVMYGVLVTHLVDTGVYQWDRAQMGWLIGIPVLTGALMRLPMGLLADKYGGHLMFPLLMTLAAVPMFLASYATSYEEFLLAGLGFGISGASFTVGVAYTSVWFRAEQQGTVLGIFGMGTAGSALTNMLAPQLLRLLTAEGAFPEGWRLLPKLYAGALLAVAIAFWLVTTPRKSEHGKGATLRERLEPLRHVRVWRFGLYYFFAFGGFVAVTQWLVPYYVNVYSMSVASAGLMAALFSLPAGVLRALGGWASDRLGARPVMYWTLSTSLLALALLFFPRMEIRSPGEGVIAERAGRVVAVSEEAVVVDDRRYRLHRPGDRDSEHDVSVRLGIDHDEEGFILFPTASFWQEPIVKVGEQVEKGQLLARGMTHVYFQANVWIFTALVLIVGAGMGIASAAVFKHIPSYFPTRVGVVGGVVGVLGGLGGFFYPIIFGYLLRGTGIWTTAWMLLALVALVCLVWMHVVVQRIMHRRVPNLVRQIDESSA